MPGKPLTNDDILRLLESDRKPSEPRPLPSNFPVEVLIQPECCNMCKRQNGPEVKVMYTVNGEPLCFPHAVYVLSWLLLDNGVDVEVAGKVPDMPGQL